MFVALLMFLSSSVWGSISFLAIAALLKINRIKHENWNTPLFRIICLISFLSVINFFVYLIVLKGVPNENSTAYYPYAIFMFFSYIVAKTITRKELHFLLLFFVIDVCIGLAEYHQGIASFWNVDLSFDEASDLLYFRRVCGINNNSSNFAEKMLLGFIILYLINPKFKYLYIFIFFVGLIISFNRSAVIASSPLLLYFIYQYIKEGGVFRKIVFFVIVCVAIYFIVIFLLPLIVEQFFRGNNDTTTAMTSRDIIWKEFLDFFYGNPITGNGSVKMRSSTGQHAHNSYIWVLASNGIIIASFYYYYTIRFVNRYNFIPIFSIMLTSITQSTIYWGLSNADIFLFVLILHSHSKILQEQEKGNLFFNITDRVYDTI